MGVGWGGMVGGYDFGWWRGRWCENGLLKSSRARPLGRRLESVKGRAEINVSKIPWWKESIVIIEVSLYVTLVSRQGGMKLRDEDEG